MYTILPASTITSPAPMSLRDHLLAAQAAAGQSTTTTVELHSTPAHGNHSNSGSGSGSGDQLDPQMVPSYESSPVTPGMEPQNPEVRKGRRELSTSKRAAQNRAAQRAFRQRKEQYISTLKAQVNEHEQIATLYKVLEHENLALREYIILLQTELLAHGVTNMPPPPVDLGRPSARIAAAAAAAAAAVERDAHAAAHQDEMSVEAQLQAAAAAVDEGRTSDDEVGTTDLTAELHAAAEAAMESARGIGNSEVDMEDKDD